MRRLLSVTAQQVAAVDICRRTSTLATTGASGFIDRLRGPRPRRRGWPTFLFAVITAMPMFCTGSAVGASKSVTVSPSENLQTLVDQNPTSTRFTLKPGTYRLQSVIPKDDDSFVGQTGAIVSGAALLTNFTQAGSYWTASVDVTEASSYRGVCSSSSPACAYPEDLFFNSVPKVRVTSLSAVGAGTWYLNYTTGTAYIGDDPSGSTVEISLLPYAFSGNAQSVTLNNLVIEKYACQAGSGAVDGESGSSSWTVENSEIRYNHGMGVGIGDGMYVYKNNIHNNGELGVGGNGTGGASNVRVNGNTLSYNNYAGYSVYWEAGGAKFCTVTNLTAANNTSTNNNGPGIWVDLTSQTVTLSGNQTSNNVEAGILYEISYGGTIKNNTLTNDGYNSDGSNLWWGAGILISDSSDVTITGNTVTNCMNGIGGIINDRGNNPSGVPYTLENVVANQNTITQNTGTAMGIVVGAGYNNSVYTSMGNNFQDNTFNLTNPSTGLYFYWLQQYMTLAQFNRAIQ